MNRFRLSKLLVAACIMALATTHSQAQGIHTSQLLSGGDSCLHVIRSVQIHGVNNSFDMAGTAVSGFHGPFGSYAMPHAELGDLEIVGVAHEQLADPACGPQFHITIRNNSCRDVCRFHVTLVATLGRIFPDSPNATVCVDTICAGQETVVCVQLPVEALAMGNHNGQVIGFQKLVVAIDAFDELAETNEANNLMAFSVGEIPPFTAAIEQEPTTDVGGAATLETTALPSTINSPDAVGSPAVGVSPQVAPSAPPAQDDAENSDALRNAIQMIDRPADAAGSNDVNL